MATAKQCVELAERRLFSHYGLEVRTSTIQLRRPWLQLRVLESGRGEPIVFLHSEGGISSQWAPLWAHLTGRRCIGIDLPGFGLSQEVHYHQTSLREFAADVVRGTLDELGLTSAPLVGHSLGGAFALWAASDQPGRITHLALLGAPVPAVKGTRVNLPLATLGIRGLNRFLLNLPLPPLPVNRALYRLTLGGHAVAGSPPEIIEVAHHAMDRPTFAPSMTSLMEEVFHFRRPKSEFVLADDTLQSIEQPTLLVWGDHDVFGSTRVARRLVERLPNARLVEMGAGHHPWLDRPRECAVELTELLDPRGTARARERGTVIGRYPRSRPAT